MNKVISFTVKCLLTMLAIAVLLWVFGVDTLPMLAPFGVAVCGIVVVAALVYVNIQARQTED